MAKKEFAPTGFIEESGVKFTSSDPQAIAGMAQEYNDEWRARSEQLAGWGHSKKLFAGAMDLLGVHGHEVGGARTFDSTRDLAGLHGGELPGASRGLTLCESGKGEHSMLPVGNTITPVDVRIEDTYMWAHEGSDTPTERKTRLTTITITPRRGDDELLDEHKQSFIPIFDKQTDRSGHTTLTRAGIVPAGEKPYYPPDICAREVSIKLVDGNVAMIYLNTRGMRDEGFGPGVIGVDVGKLMDRQREINEGTAKGQDLRSEMGMKILDSVTKRVAGMMDLAAPAIKMTKEKRIKHADDMTRVAARAAERLDLLPDILDPEWETKHPLPEINEADRRHDSLPV